MAILFINFPQRLVTMLDEFGQASPRRIEEYSQHQQRFVTEILSADSSTCGRVNTAMRVAEWTGAQLIQKT